MPTEVTPVRSIGTKIHVARFVWGITAALCFVVIIVSEFISLQQGSQEYIVDSSYRAVSHLVSYQAYLGYILVVRHVLLFSFIAVAILVLWHRTDDWMALLVSITLILLPVTFFFGNISQNSTIPAPWDAYLMNLEALLAMTVLGCCLALYSSFPDGVFKPVWLFPFMAAAFILIVIFMGLANSNEIFWLASVLTFAAMLLVGVTGQIYRYRRNKSSIHRQQIKWVLFAFFMMAVSFPISIFLPLVIVDESRQNLINLHIQFLVFPIIPLSFAVAILRYRLWDIDLIIRRTLQYTLLTGLLALFYFGGIALFQVFLTLMVGGLGPAVGDYFSGLEAVQISPPTDGSPPPVFEYQPPPAVIVLTTLAIAALFNPLRRRLQDFIDRRFYRQKYDAERALLDFAAAARSETDLEHLSDTLLATIQETVQPDGTQLWLTHIEEER